MSGREDIDWEREEGGVKNGGVVVDEDDAGEIKGGEFPVEADHATMLTDNAGPRTLFIEGLIRPSDDSHDFLEDSQAEDPDQYPRISRTEGDTASTSISKPVKQKKHTRNKNNADNFANFSTNGSSVYLASASMASAASLSESWTNSLENSEPMKLILPDARYRPYYLPTTAQERQEKAAKLEERAKQREMYLCSRVDENSVTSVAANCGSKHARQQLFKLDKKPRLCIGDQ
jgi:hypothetical protein